MKLFAAALLLALPALAPSLDSGPEALARDKQDKVQLRWKWTKGQELTYKHSQKMIMEVAGQPIEQNMGYTYSMTVNEVADSGEATLTIKYLAIVAKGTIPQEYDYDSEKDKEAPTEGPAAMQAKMIGQSFTMKLDPLGRVTSVQGYDKVLDAILKGAPDDNPQTRMQAKQMYNDEAFKGQMQQMFPPLPDGKVGKDDAWKSEFIVKVPMLGGMTYSQDSKITDFKDGNALFDQALKVEMKDKDNPLAGIMELQEAKGKASAAFSPEKGCIVSQKQTMAMKLAVQGNPMTMTITGEMKLVSRK
jgi:hypothetical protein